MKRKLVFATNNAHKLEEIAAILGDKVELLSLNDIDCHTDIPETAETLEGNALLKSSFIYRNYQLDCFADDTGLEVEALNGAPGVYSARYAEGEGHDAQANMRKLLHELEGKENRKAQFRTAISLILDGILLTSSASIVVIPQAPVRIDSKKHFTSSDLISDKISQFGNCFIHIWIACV